jgi:hypothetical protein
MKGSADGFSRAAVVPRDGALLVALGLLSAAVTAQQIALMQVLGWMHWHHFAYLVVAVALLGFGVAGTVLSLARDRMMVRWPLWLPWLLLGAALAMPLGLRLAQTELLAVDLPLVFFAPGNAWRLAALCLLLLPPFFCGGLFTGIVLTAHARHAGRYYAASLAGAGIGGLAGLALVAGVAPPRLPAAAGWLALIAAIALWRRTPPAGRVALIAGAGVLALLLAAPGALVSSQFKPLRRTLDLPDARIVAERPSVHGWVQVVTAPALRPAPAVSFAYLEEIPPQPAVFVNGIPYGSLPATEGPGSPRWLDYTTDAAAFATLRPRSVLLLENGPEGWAALATAHGATRVVVVEPNRALTGLLTSGPTPLAPEWGLPGVELAATRGRAFLRRATGTFDLIRFPGVGALGGTAGLGAASEQFLQTREAFIDAWHRLTPGGVISASAWMDFPERNPLRLLATLAEALESAGAPPGEHLVAVRGWATVTFLARREPWSEAAVAALREFCRDRGFDPLLLPNLQPAEREEYHAWQNPSFFTMVDALVHGPREPVYRDYAFLVRPATDNRPYFSQFIRWTRTDRLREVFGARAMPFFELGSLVVALTFGILLVLAVGCIALPLVRLGWAVPGKAGVLMYFGGLGAGFMCVEIGLMLRAHAWLGSPVLAAAVVITVLLIASGAGSLWSERLHGGPVTQRRAAAGIALAIVAGSTLLALLGPLARTWPAPVQVLVLVAIVAAVGFPMGTAFPLGIRTLEATYPPHIPWAWAINGCVSVATPAGAMLLAMNAGFVTLFAAAVVAYALAVAGTLAFRRHAAPGTEARLNAG